MCVQQGLGMLHKRCVYASLRACGSQAGGHRRLRRQRMHTPLMRRVRDQVCYAHTSKILPKLYDSSSRFQIKILLPKSKQNRWQPAGNINALRTIRNSGISKKEKGSESSSLSNFDIFEKFKDPKNQSFKSSNFSKKFEISIFRTSNFLQISKFWKFGFCFFFKSSKFDNFEIFEFRSFQKLRFFGTSKISENKSKLAGIFEFRNFKKFEIRNRTSNF